MITKTSFISLVVMVMLLLFNCEEEKSSGFVDISGFKIPYFIEGHGIPCIIVSDAIPQKRALSQKLREYFKFIFIEQRISIENDSSVNYKA
jgi:hypothetical protein